MASTPALDSAVPTLAPGAPLPPINTDALSAAILFGTESGDPGTTTGAPTRFDNTPVSVPPSTSTLAPTETLTSTVSNSAPRATSTAESNGNPIPLNIVLPAVIAPVVLLLIAIPLGIFFYFRWRNKKQREARMGSPDMYNGSTGAALLHKQSEPSMSYAPFTDGEKHLNHPSTHSSLEQDNQGEVIALNARNRSWSEEKRHHPSPPLPSTGVAMRPQRPERPKPRPKTNEAWPLPAHETLPDPIGRPSTSKSNKSISAGPHHDSPSLPPVQLHEPLTLHSSLATDSSLYDLSSTAKNFPDTPGAGASLHRKRESDLVSELSNSDRDIRPSARRDTDAVSVVSAITNRSRSQRRKSSSSAVSALSPDEPELPIRPFGMR